MTSPELENLAAIGQLRREVSAPSELNALIRSGRARLADAAHAALAVESRFDLAYNAAHALALAALRFRGYRSENRYLVFQVLELTAGVPASTWRVLAKAHGERNLSEYEGAGEIDQRLLTDLIAAARAVERAVTALMRPPGPSA